MNKIDLENFMAEKGFDFFECKQNDKKLEYTYVNNDKQIIAKVYSGLSFELNYTNRQIIGIFTSGLIEIDSNKNFKKVFEKIYNNFLQSVEKLKNGTNKLSKKEWTEICRIEDKWCSYEEVKDMNYEQAEEYIRTMPTFEPM